MTLPLSPGLAQPWRPGCIALLTLLSAASCVKELPPAPTPARVLPSVAASTPLAEGRGRLVVDVVEGPTAVHRIRMSPREIDDGHGKTRYRFFESSELLCSASPCVADLAPGNILLGFPVRGDPGAMETELVHVAARSTVYRRSLSRYDDSTGATRVLGIIGASLGGAAATTGVVLLPIGLGKDNEDLALAGGITLGAGAALAALGIWAVRHDAPTYRPGSSVHFPAEGPESF